MTTFPSRRNDFSRKVWSGTEEQGNNQINIFKDTGYLVTSTVDGYNVCIFAYGQVCPNLVFCGQFFSAK